MSYPIGMDVLHLKRRGRPAHMEYCSNEALVRAVTGLDPRKDGRAWGLFHDAWQIDLVWSPEPWTVSGSPRSAWETKVGIALPSSGRIRSPKVLKIRTMPTSTPYRR